MELTLSGSLSRILVSSAICSCLCLTSCSSDDDPVKSYSNYRITVDAASPVSFAAQGESKTITVSATREICWNGQPSGETEIVQVTAKMEGEQFVVEPLQANDPSQLQITAKENETEEILKGKLVLTVQDESGIETQALELVQEAAIIQYGVYRIAFENERASLDYHGGHGMVAFTCQREKMINGKSKGLVNHSLNGISYKATQKNNATYNIKKGTGIGAYMLEYNLPEALTIHEVSNTFSFLNEHGEDIASFVILLAGNPNGDDNYFVSTEISGIYQE